MKVRLPKARVQFSAKQNKAMNEEILRQFNEKKLDSSKHLDCMLLLMLHRKYGFGYKRLIDFHKDFVDEFNRFCEHYDMDGKEVAAIKLKEDTGIDIDELYESEGINQ